MDSSSVDEVIKIMKISPFYPLAKKSIIDLIIVNGSFSGSMSIFIGE
jgi:hypothetical protein